MCNNTIEAREFVRQTIVKKMRAKSRRERLQIADLAPLVAKHHIGADIVDAALDDIESMHQFEVINRERGLWNACVQHSQLP
jgi:methylmalonyl-CoA mutase cobalamin-binding subunit